MNRLRECTVVGYVPSLAAYTHHYEQIYWFGANLGSEGPDQYVYPCSGHSLPAYRSIRYCRIQLQYNLNGSNTDGSFTVDDSNSFFSPYKILPIAQENKYLMIFFLFYHGNVCCVYSLESPRRGDSNEYTQHTIIVQKLEKNH